MDEKELAGEITHFFDKISVAVVELSRDLKKGDKISVEGITTNFVQTVESMQIEHADIKEAKAGQAVGMKMSEKARPGDRIFKITE